MQQIFSKFAWRVVCWKCCTALFPFPINPPHSSLSSYAGSFNGHYGPFHSPQLYLLRISVLLPPGGSPRMLEWLEDGKSAGGRPYAKATSRPLRACASRRACSGCKGA
uniref:Putative secreted protein n=1 Tax=Ixodes ricinus TaxID=34613 RepID=A0A6B0UGV5_IXORI